MVSSLSIYLNLFQSTHPRGVRQEEVIKDIQAAEDFNPRTREGCDAIGPWFSKAVSYFNPRTREGCDDLIQKYKEN